MFGVTAGITFRERQQIAANALGKILDAHTFEHRIQTMLSVIDGQ